ncbi:MAG: hypothetical protein KKH60_08595 [Proteobacteria bacterium]|nr:hypothetical protein [Pseudomonadota bacterium]MBU1139816.1 hypothetical protein [Pseudomonadota bacterium]
MLADIMISQEIVTGHELENIMNNTLIGGWRKNIPRNHDSGTPGNCRFKISGKSNG